MSKPHFPLSAAARRAASAAGERTRHRKAQVRREFIRHPKALREEADPAQPLPEPPMVKLIRGGRSGGQSAVRLKLYLSILWMSAGAKRADVPPHSTVYPAVFWAELLNLDQPETKGKRRISEALAWLDDHEFVKLTHRPGAPPIVTVLREDGSGRAYRLPTAKNEEGVAEGAFVSLPATFWENHWIAALSATGISLLLILNDWRDRQPHETGEEPPIWLSPKMKERYHLSEDSWRKGKAELLNFELVSVSRELVRRQPMDEPRWRDEYKLNPKAFERSPWG